MYIRPIHVRKGGKRHGYWALVESYRTQRGPRQRTVAYLGQLDEEVRLGVKHAAKGHAAAGHTDLFDKTRAEWVEVDARRVRVERCRDFGGPWLALQLARKVGLCDFLRRTLPSGREGLEVKLCPSPDGQETFILCRSRQRREKEKAMHERFEKRIEDGLRKIQESCGKRRYKPVTIAKRVGRLLERNSRAAGLFESDVGQEADGRAKLLWKKAEARRDWAQLSEGCYLLRSNMRDWSAQDLWLAYIQLTEAEAAFRIHKTDLRVRPIWHQKQQRVRAHILVCFLAYVLWKTLGRMCGAAGLGEEPRRVFQELSKVKVVDVILPTRRGVEIRKRCVTRPTQHQAILLQRLGLRLPRSTETTEM